MEKKSLIVEGLKKSIEYSKYEEVFEGLAAEKKIKGFIYDLMYNKYMKLNWSRHKRFEKKLKLSEAGINYLKNNESSITWLVITEPWCGDSAASLPVLYQMAKEMPNADFKIVFRDQYIPLIKAFLTGTSMAIPKLILLDEENNPLETWGARPKAAQEIMEEFKKSGTGDKDQVYTDIQKWYTKDKGQSIEREIIELLEKIENS